MENWENFIPIWRVIAKNVQFSCIQPTNALFQTHPIFLHSANVQSFAKRCNSVVSTIQVTVRFLQINEPSKYFERFGSTACFHGLPSTGNNVVDKQKIFLQTFSSIVDVVSSFQLLLLLYLRASYCASYIFVVPLFCFCCVSRRKQKNYDLLPSRNAFNFSFL